MVQWLRLHTPIAGALSSSPGRGTRSHMLQLEILCAAMTIPPATAKTWCQKREREKQDTKGHTLYNSIYIQSGQVHRDRKYISGYQRMGEMQMRSDYLMGKVLLCGVIKYVRITVARVEKSCKYTKASEFHVL